MLNYIIVGFGLSGLATAFRLEERGKDFVIFDAGLPNASRVAGGIMNPIILKRLKSARNAEKAFPFSVAFYENLQEKLNKKFIFSQDIYRRFASVEEQNNWFEAADNPFLEDFLDIQLQKDLYPYLKSEYGFGRVKGTKIIDTNTLISSAENYFIKKGNFRGEKFNYEDLKLKSDAVEYSGISAEKIIFCDGFGLLQNPFFNYLPLKGNKGEYIIIHAPELKLKEAVKASVFILPLGNDLYKVGATYNSKDHSSQTTLRARNELREKLDKVVSCNYEVVDQVAGVRPSSGDRQPMIGIHPEFANLYCCNGFGSRGVISAPFVAEKLINSIENSEEISPDLNISRFHRRWKRKNDR